MTDRIVEVLFTAAGVLFGPALALLALATAGALWMLGGLLGEALDRSRGRGDWNRLIARLKDGDESESGRAPGPEAVPARFRGIARLAGRSPIGARKALDDLELAMARRLSGLTFATRVGPMLGLIGTLLPLGPALRGLASNDLAALAGDLEIAFTSTVFGLLIGGTAYAAGIVRRNWYDQDVADLEFVFDLISRASNPAAADEPVEAPAHA